MQVSKTHHTKTHSQTTIKKSSLKTFSIDFLFSIDFFFIFTSIERNLNVSHDCALIG